MTGKIAPMGGAGGPLPIEVVKERVSLHHLVPKASLYLVDSGSRTSTYDEFSQISKKLLGVGGKRLQQADVTQLLEVRDLLMETRKSLKKGPQIIEFEAVANHLPLDVVYDVKSGKTLFCSMFHYRGKCSHRNVLIMDKSGRITDGVEFRADHEMAHISSLSMKREEGQYSCFVEGVDQNGPTLGFFCVNASQSPENQRRMITAFRDIAKELLKLSDLGISVQGISLDDFLKIGDRFVLSPPSSESSKIKENVVEHFFKLLFESAKRYKTFFPKDVMQQVNAFVEKLLPSTTMSDVVKEFNRLIPKVPLDEAPEYKGALGVLTCKLGHSPSGTLKIQTKELNRGKVIEHRYPSGLMGVAKRVSFQAKQWIFDGFVLPEAPLPGVLSIADRQMLSMLNLPTRIDMRRLIQCKDRLFKLRDAIPLEKRYGVIELKSSSDLTPLSMRMDLHTGEVFIRSKNIRGRGGYKEYRDVLVIAPSGEYKHVVECSVVSHHKCTKSVDELKQYYSDLDREMAIVETRGWIPHIIHPPLVAITRKKTFAKEVVEKKSFIMSLANPQYPDMAAYIRSRGSGRLEDGAFILRILLNLGETLKVMESHNSVYCDLKWEQLHIFENKEVKLGDFGAVVDMPSGKKHLDYQSVIATHAPMETDLYFLDQSMDLYCVGKMIAAIAHPSTKFYTTQQRHELKNLSRDLMYERGPREYETTSQYLADIRKHRGDTAQLINRLKRIEVLGKLSANAHIA